MSKNQKDTTKVIPLTGISPIKMSAKARQTNNCARHKRLKDVFPGDIAKTLARKIADLHYEDYPPLFAELAQAIKEDGHKDNDAGRTQLGTLLLGLAGSIKHTTEISKEIWKLCKPFMEKTKK